MTTVSAKAERVDLEIHAGTDIRIPVDVVGNDGKEIWLDDWTSKLFVGRELVVKLTLTSENGGIKHYPATNAINQLYIDFQADDTRLMSGEYDYELKVYSSTGKEEMVVWGTLTVKATADRSEA